MRMDVAKPEPGQIEPAVRDQEKKTPPSVRQWLAKLGPGLVTGASDDDPSGIATYSPGGAQFGYGLLWTLLLSFPLIAAIQGGFARIWRVSGGGLAANLPKRYSPPPLFPL